MPQSLKHPVAKVALWIRNSGSWIFSAVLEVLHSVTGKLELKLSGSISTRGVFRKASSQRAVAAVAEGWNVKRPTLECAFSSAAVVSGHPSSSAATTEKSLFEHVPSGSQLWARLLTKTVRNLV